MLLISHRGNLKGSCPEKENHPDYIKEALNLGYDCEIDLWLTDNSLCLGHDKPEYIIDFKFLTDRYNCLWIHCKNLAALDFLARDNRVSNDYWNLIYFWHQNDDFVLTSNNYIWTYPNKTTTKSSIIVVQELKEINFECYGICTDYPELYDRNGKLK